MLYAENELGLFGLAAVGSTGAVGWPAAVNEAVAHTFAEEMAQLRALLHSACREVHGEAEVQALTSRLVGAFIAGEPGPSHAPRGRHTGA
jgi:hypothetical protein